MCNMRSPHSASSTRCFRPAATTLAGRQAAPLRGVSAWLPGSSGDAMQPAKVKPQPQPQPQQAASQHAAPALSAGLTWEDTACSGCVLLCQRIWWVGRGVGGHWKGVAGQGGVPPPRPCRKPAAVPDASSSSGSYSSDNELERHPHRLENRHWM